MPRPPKRQKPLAYGHGHIARAPNGRGYDAALCLSGRRLRARLPTLDAAKAWLDAQDPTSALGPTLDTLTDDAIRAYVAPLPPHTRNRTLRAISAFASWCVGLKLLPANPTQNIPLARVQEPTRAILTPEQAQSLLAHTLATDPALLPYVAIGLFAGLRPEETKRLRPSDIGAEYILLTPAHTKTAQARTVLIRPNLRTILANHPIHPQGITAGLSLDRFNKRLTALIRASGLPWAQDILRHSFASYAYEASRDASATAYEMGHRGTDIFFRHYRGLVPPGSGNAFFALTI